MPRLIERFRKTTADVDVQEASGSLMERAKDLVEDVIDRVEGVVEDRPSARDAAGELRRNGRAADLASAAVVAIGPAVMRTLRDRRMQRMARRRTVAVVVARPVVLGSGLAAAAVGGWALLRLARRLRGTGTAKLQQRNDAFVAGTDPTSYTLEQEVGRMLDDDSMEELRGQPGGANGAAVATPSPH